MSGFQSELRSLGAVSTYRRYIFVNALSEVRTRYAGTSLGVIWHIAYPLTIVLVLGAVLSGAVVSRNPRLSTLGAGLSIACGLLPWLAFSDALSRGTNSLIEHSLYLRKLAIPEEVYIAKSIAASSIYFAILLCFLVILVICDGRTPSVLFILLPVISVLLLLVAFGAALTLAPLNVLMRDIGQTLPLLLQLGMWLSPILYPAELMPHGLGVLQKLNPFSPFLAAFRSVVVENQIPGLGIWLAMLAWATGACAVGAVFIQRTRHELRDYL
jgi:lipopolysaccharide transport system permease protein